MTHPLHSKRHWGQISPHRQTYGWFLKRSTWKIRKSLEDKRMMVTQSGLNCTVGIAEQSVKHMWSKRSFYITNTTTLLWAIHIYDSIWNLIEDVTCMMSCIFIITQCERSTVSTMYVRTSKFTAAIFSNLQNYNNNTIQCNTIHAIKTIVCNFLCYMFCSTIFKPREIHNCFIR